MQLLIRNGSTKGIIIWLYTGIVLVFSMIAIGGITRLTESGLSITEWNVVMGSIPPMNDADWQSEFNKYKTSPEFQYKNFDFTLQDFKSIYWWEWIHRELGRIIGLVFILPFLYFIYKKRFTSTGIKRLLVILFFGGLQGFLGWYMVKSGLVDEPRVSHYRLAMHLMTALITISLIWWFILDIKRNEEKISITRSYTILLRLFFSFFFIQLIYGAFVAGLDAGQIYNTWPLMGNKIAAPGAFSGKPFLSSFYDSGQLVTIQFLHRTIAMVVWSFILVLWLRARKEGYPATTINQVRGMFVLVNLQFGLGILTLLLAVPVWLGVLHQLGAVLLLLSSLYHIHGLKTKTTV